MFPSRLPMSTSGPYFLLVHKRGFVAYSGNDLSLPLWSSLHFDFKSVHKGQGGSKWLFLIVEMKWASCSTAGSHRRCTSVGMDNAAYVAGRLALLCAGYSGCCPVMRTCSYKCTLAMAGFLVPCGGDIDRLETLLRLGNVVMGDSRMSSQKVCSKHGRLRHLGKLRDGALEITQSYPRIIPASLIVIMLATVWLLLLTLPLMALNDIHMFHSMCGAA